MRLFAENLGKLYGQRWVFTELNFEIKSGFCLGVNGPNGSGKSTLLRILNGLSTPTAGKLAIENDNGVQWPVFPQQLIGTATNDFQLYDELTAEENLIFFSGLRDVSVGQDKLLERVGLRNVGRQRVAEFSSGMKQRLKLAFALVSTPPILILDEPGISLDASGRQLVSDIVIQGKRNGIVIVASNDDRELVHADYLVDMGKTGLDNY